MRSTNVQIVTSGGHLEPGPSEVGTDGNSGYSRSSESATITGSMGSVSTLKYRCVCAIVVRPAHHVANLYPA